MLSRQRRCARLQAMRSITVHALDCTQLLHNPMAQLRMRWPRATQGSRVYVDVLDHGALDPGPHAQSLVRSIVGLCALLHRLGLLA